MGTDNEEMRVDIAVVQQQQIALDRRHDSFMKQVGDTMTQINTRLAETADQIESIHGHINRCREDLREEIERDFMTKTEGERIRGSISKINTKIHMTGLGIVFALSLVQIAIAVYA